MQKKQNNKFVLSRLYPEYFKPVPLPQIIQQIEQYPPIRKGVEEKKIQSKLKTIVYNLEKEIQEQIFGKGGVGGDSRASLGSEGGQVVSEREIGKMRYHTDHERKLSNDTTQQAILKARLRRSTEKPYQNQPLILPKLRPSNSTNNLDRLQKSIKRQKKRIQKLSEKQQELGGIVLQKVEQHFEKEKKGRKNYYQRVKSEESIDISLLKYLKNQIKKADVVLGN